MSINRGLLTLSLLVPLVAASATANAGATISDRRYLPNEARQAMSASPAATQRDPTSAFAYDPSRLTPTTVPDAGEPAWRYHGGPKSR